MMRMSAVLSHTGSPSCKLTCNVNAKNNYKCFPIELQLKGGVTQKAGMNGFP